MREHMRKEIFGICLFFLVIFTLISLLSFSPADPSIHHAREAGRIHNLFGLVGAHLAGILIGFFAITFELSDCLYIMTIGHYMQIINNRLIVILLS